MRAIVEYDGGGYAGFQRQRDLPSVQGALEMAILAATGHNSRITAAGRTDAGAHATGQVISFAIDSRLDDSTLLQALNSHLPPDIALQSVMTTTDRFDPRRMATGRTYRYLVINRSTPSPLWKGRAHHIRQTLDLSRMREGARFLIGTHDFSAFGTPITGASAVRDIVRLDINQMDDMVTFEITGSGFMQHMIRTIAGTLAQVGLGKMAPEEVGAILASRDRKRPPAPLPAHGLYLVEVDFGKEPTL